jgi:hypothetical protein
MAAKLAVPPPLIALLGVLGVTGHGSPTAEGLAVAPSTHGGGRVISGVALLPCAVFAFGASIKAEAGSPPSVSASEDFKE